MTARPPEIKALDACRDYAQANIEIRRLTVLIGDSLEACGAAWREANEDGCFHMEYTSHLAKAYTPEVVSHAPDDLDQLFLTPDEQEALLAECSHCLAAHRAVQARKHQRKRLGIAKRLITKVGRAA